MEIPQTRQLKLGAVTTEERTQAARDYVSLFMKNEEDAERGRNHLKLRRAEKIREEYALSREEIIGALVEAGWSRERSEERFDHWLGDIKEYRFIYDSNLVKRDYVAAAKNAIDGQLPVKFEERVLFDALDQVLKKGGSSAAHGLVEIGERHGLPFKWVNSIAAKHGILELVQIVRAQHAAEVEDRARSRQAIAAAAAAALQRQTVPSSQASQDS